MDALLHKNSNLDVTHCDIRSYLRLHCVLPLLQDNQKDLENATEQLSEYLERDITSDMLFDIKQKVQDKSRSVMYTAYHLCSGISLSLSW